MFKRRIGKILCLILIVNVFAFSQYEEKVISKTIEVNPDVKLIMKNKFGKIKISGQNKNVISIDAKISIERNDSDGMIDEIQVVIKESRSLVDISTTLPSKYEKNSAKSIKIEYTISVPLNAVLDIVNSFGQMDIDNISGDTKINGSFGNINMNNCRSKNIVKAKYSDITAKVLGSNSQVSNEFGKIQIEDVSGNLAVDASFGDMIIKHIEGDLDVKSNFGDIDIDDVEGHCKISKSKFGSIKTRNIRNKTVSVEK